MIVDPNKQTYKDNYKLLIGSIVPRPIAFVSTVSSEGHPNIAPFSFFNGVCSNPPTIVFAPVRRSTDAQPKDTLVNIRDTGDFVVNIPDESILEEMVATATEFDPDVNEFDVAGLHTCPSRFVNAPGLLEAKIRFECSLNQIIEIGDGSAGSGFLVVGTVELFHVDDAIIDHGRIDLEKLNPVGRLAGNNYCRVHNSFEVVRKINPD